MVCLALDLGTKRTGVAISRSGLLAEIWGVLTGAADKQLLELQQVIASEAVDVLVIGQPRDPASPVGRLAEFVRAHLSKERPSLRIVAVDETLTTKEAERLAKDRRVPPTLTDSLAAQLILEQFLEEVSMKQSASQ